MLLILRMWYGSPDCGTVWKSVDMCGKIPHRMCGYVWIVVWREYECAPPAVMQTGRTMYKMVFFLYYRIAESVVPAE